MKHRLFHCVLFLGATNLSAAPPPESFGLVAHWTFDRNLASRVNNALYAGTPHGGARLQIDRSPGAARVGEGALRLDSGLKVGEPTYVSVGTPPGGLAGNDVLTLTAWFKLKDIGGDGTDTRNFVWESVPNSALVFSVNTQQRKKTVQFRFRSENYRTFQETTDGPVMTPDAWHHVATVWNARARHVRVYLDGKMHKELPLADADVLEPIRGLHIGGNKTGDGLADWDGWIDDVAIFDVELTARQVAALAQGGEISAANVLTRVPEPAVQRIPTAGRALPAPAIPAHETTSQGPLIGAVSERDAVVWARVPHEGEYALTAKSSDGHVVKSRVTALETNDWCLHWHLTELKPRTTYSLTFELPAGSPFALRPLTMRTPAAPAEPATVVLGFGSCIDFPSNHIWTRIAAECPDGMVLLGDTPYIDTTKLDGMRWAYRRLSSSPPFVAAFQTIPFWATWDDHDFGRNDSDGTLPGKENSRRAFLEYRPTPSAGENGLGVYASFRRGPVEVFLLDTRWFSRTERSWADPAKMTLLGRQQWKWLQRGLRASTAPFKVLACGMIWDGKGGSIESDAWGSYAYEREALFRWLGENKISGVMLIGGDIHVSRLMRFPTRGSLGYDLIEYIVSPMHDRVFPHANLKDPNLVASAEEAWVFLKMTADSTAGEPTLVAELVNRDGMRFFRQELRAGELRTRE
ncbi:MAG: hypothetical protein EXS37_11660 [Opitutus sp.]|nr:hypothetical protein [Opitutus sp.]